MIDVKMNFKRKYKEYNCDHCGMHDIQVKQTQKHIMKCPILVKENNISTHDIPNYKYLKPVGDLKEKIKITRIIQINIHKSEEILSYKKVT